MSRHWMPFWEGVDEQGRWVPRVIHPDDDLPDPTPARAPRMTPKRALSAVRAAAFKHRAEIARLAGNPKGLRMLLADIVRAEGGADGDAVAAYLERGRGGLPPAFNDWLSTLPGWPSHPAPTPAEAAPPVSAGRGFGDFAAARDYEQGDGGVGSREVGGPVGGDRPDEADVVKAVGAALSKGGGPDSPAVRQALLMVPRQDRDHVLKQAMRQSRWHPPGKDTDPARVIEYIPEDERIENIKWADDHGPESQPYCLRVLVMGARASGVGDPIEFAKQVARGDHYRHVEASLAVVNRDMARLDAVLDTAEFVALMQSRRVNLFPFNRGSHTPGKIDDQSTGGREKARGDGTPVFHIGSGRGDDI